MPRTTRRYARASRLLTAAALGVFAWGYVWWHSHMELGWSFTPLVERTGVPVSVVALAGLALVGAGLAIAACRSRDYDSVERAVIVALAAIMAFLVLWLGTLVARSF